MCITVLARWHRLNGPVDNRLSTLLGSIGIGSNTGTYATQRTGVNSLNSTVTRAALSSSHP